MKKYLLTIFTLIFSSTFAFAQDQDVLDLKIKEIQSDWAISKYESKNDDQKIEGYRNCADKSKNLVKQFPNSAEALIWEGICLSSEAELTKLTALGKIKTARQLFEKAAKIDEKALSGSAYTNLAVLYHRVPGWPISFGDDEKAEQYFEKVLKIAPENIDANYFYALFLEDVKDDYRGAIKYLNIALNAPSRNRPLADKMRREEISKKIAEFTKEIQ